jgi:hypothetical protein
MNTMRRSLPVLMLALAACSGGGSEPVTTVKAPSTPPKAVCGAGSQAELGLQGRVSREEFESGRAAEGYTCNAALVGSYRIPNATGTIGGFKVERYVDAAGHDCAYYDTTLMFPTNFGEEAGVNVLDMSDPANPVRTERLVTPAMLSPHESLVVSQSRGLLVAVTGNAAFYPGQLDIYDLSQDCRHPVVKFSGPVGVFGHESGIAPDGNTFYSASPGTSTLIAVDISNPSAPRPLAYHDIDSHGLSIGADGNRAYVAATSGHMVILDVSDVQARRASPVIREVARLTWDASSIPQNAIPVTIGGHPYVVEIDEFAVDESHDITANGPNVGAGRIIDIADEKNPKVVSNLRLEVHQPENRAAIANDPGAGNVVQGYAGHYCNVPSRVDPGIVACSMIASGLRVFDIRNPLSVREIAYFNPPVRARATPYFDGGAWAMSSPSFVPERKEIWYSDGYEGFFAVRLTNDVWQ